MARKERERDIDQTPWTRPGFVLAGLVVVLALACGLYLAVGGGGHHAASSSAAAPASTAVPTTRSPAARSTSPKETAGGRCDVPPGPQAVPTMAPSGIAWQYWRTAVLPTSPTAGPMVVYGDFARCFARSPLGALISAVQIYSRMELAMTSTEWQSIVYGQMVPSVGRDQLATMTEAAEKANPAAFAAPTPPGAFAQIAGFSFVSYDGDTAVIDLVVTKTGAYAVAPLTVSWVDGDWELDVTPSGGLTGPAQAISSTVGYIAWSGI